MNCGETEREPTDRPTDSFTDPIKEVHPWAINKPYASPTGSDILCYGGKAPL
ncbi:hypothetical protein ZHAS_00018870 [Anopheles sinensis]|uniref:Uncharacterized protein n=1 Tax=Anopheles sinensis TaxID=74873 RepID=A0A084WK19_ANOSI|nr:hypothetical protein ZHAS_00018870 [Anopheles sinensis]